MKVLNFGSMNLDYVYTVDHMVQGGETLASSDRQVFFGGKGFNQLVALAKAGVPVYHAGMIGEDGKELLEMCREVGVNTEYVRVLPGSSGHTIIQVDKEGQNSIILYGGANQKQTKEYVDEVLSNFSEGDYIILQNEINLLDYIIDVAYSRGMKIVLNPSPFNEKLETCDFSKVSIFLINEIEGKQFTGYSDSDEVLDALWKRYPQSGIVLTLGGYGVYWYDGKHKVFQKSFPVKAVDTTAAGDTFTGYFISEMIAGKAVLQCLYTASKAAAIAVSRQGAAQSIPVAEEEEKFNI